MKDFNADVSWWLEQWGMWSRADGTGKLVDTCSAMFKDVERADVSNDVGLMINDDIGGDVDKAILKIKKDPEKIASWEAIILFYYYNMSKSNIAKRQNISRPTVDKLIEYGSGVVSGALP